MPGEQWRKSTVQVGIELDKNEGSWYLIYIPRALINQPAGGVTLRSNPHEFHYMARGVGIPIVQKLIFLIS
jgi:hypothetical protein